ncbi:hypothetical protein PH5382_00667 [Phaeobacter sp. CECT 5382]|uniref:hypothetical protein n=1 Tax=Phaeobacter sp. CECT 5382 TaxID=1712645 RepID=UPI0006D9AC5D|nr:hypothetical protein [Phaeobacter sp. CECT 5382]CUH86754.1 hypothetical protein PH5382_00667 [Phaeobacter sp. CECT 5382]
MSNPEYIFAASSKPSLPWHEVPLIRATDETVKGYGQLVDDPEGFEIEIARWPQQGWRPIDQGPGDEGGWVEGIFPVQDNQRFLDRQGAVHARVSADIGQEFGVYLSCPLDEPKIKDL